MTSAARQVLRLSCCQALLVTNHVTLNLINGLAGFLLAEPKSLATLPQTTYLLGSALATIPASFAMQRYGRRSGFSVGAVCAVVGAILAASAMWVESFALLCLGSFVTGFYNAAGQYFRFAAADVADAYRDHTGPSFKERAISLVLGGGIIGGVLGPETSKLTKDMLPVTFAGSYAVLVGYALLSLLLVQGLRIPAERRSAASAPRRPLAVIMRQPIFLVAMLAATTGYGAMNLLMTATPLMMQAHHFPYGAAAFVIEWHQIAMFAPGFFTGSLVKRLGAPRIILIGCGLMVACVAITLAGLDLMSIWSALLVLGIGWNFMYVGGTTLLTTSYAPAEKAKVQGTNDFLVFTITIASSFSSGLLFVVNGWNWLNWLALPLVAIAAAATSGWMLAQRAAPRSKEGVTHG